MDIKVNSRNINVRGINKICSLRNAKVRLRNRRVILRHVRITFKDCEK